MTTVRKSPVRPQRSPSKKRLEGVLKWVSETPRAGKEQKLSSSIGQLIENLGYSERLSEQKAVEIWAEVVGPGIAAISRATEITDGVLKVQVVNPSWKQELGFMTDQIRFQLNRALGRDLVTKIKLY